MTESSIDSSVTHLYDIWRIYRKGKKRTVEMNEFEFDLEENLLKLSEDLKNGAYCHGEYRQFEINEGKKRIVSVASVRDRIVQRLVGEFLQKLLDKKINYDAWSGRTNKGLLKAIRRAQTFAKKHRNFLVMKIDIKKFFDSVSHKYLDSILNKQIEDRKALDLCLQIVRSFNEKTGVGMPIGNVTSQIFSHLYFSSVDKLLSDGGHMFIRYGDDILIFCENISSLKEVKEKTGLAIKKIDLTINKKSSYFCKVKKGIRFLGCQIFPKGRRLQKCVKRRAVARLNIRNASSYADLFQKHHKFMLELGYDN